MSVTHIYLKVKGESDSDLDKKIFYWKERFEFIFVLLMAVLLIYLFSPGKEKTVMIDGETKLLLYLFGIVLLITAKWGDFFHEAEWFQYLQKSVGSSR
jgi:Ca2+/H+ antiporter